MFSRGQKTTFEKWPVFGLILTYVLKTEWARSACQYGSSELTCAPRRHESQVGGGRNTFSPSHSADTRLCTCVRTTVAILLTSPTMTLTTPQQRPTLPTRRAGIDRRLTASPRPHPRASPRRFVSASSGSARADGRCPFLHSLNSSSFRLDLNTLWGTYRPFTVFWCQ